MFKPDPLRWLPAWLFIAVLPAFAQAPPGQAQDPSAAPVSSSILPPASAPASGSAPTSPPDAQQPSTTVQQIQPTPEETGDSMEARQRYQAAIEAYAKVKPSTASAWNKMGIAYQMLFNLKDAQRCYKESIKLDPHNATTINNLATTFDSMKQYGQAEKMYRKALKVDPKSAIIHKNLGTNLMVQHKYNKGLQAYKEAMTLDPGVFQDRNSPRVSNPANVQERGAMNYYMALGCVRTGQTNCALEYLRNALNEGYITAKKLASDDEFLTLRDNPAFQQLLADQKQQPQKQ